MIIRKTTDVISLKIGELTVKVSPLNRFQKIQVQDMISKGTVADALSGTNLALKYCLKDIQGLKNEDGSDYSLSKDGEGFIGDEALDDIMNADFGDDLSRVALNLVNKIPNEFIDPETGLEMKGVKILQRGETSTKK